MSIINGEVNQMNMKINNSNHNLYNIQQPTKTNNNDSKLMNTKSTQDSLEIRGHANNYVDVYNNLGKIKSDSLGVGERFGDIGTAAETTVTVNRSAFDAIANYSTYNEPKWEELGVDNEKRWVVINGQRFEVPHSPEEKAMRNRKNRTLVDMLNDYDKENEILKSDNKETLKENTKVIELLEKVFGQNTFEGIWNVIV